jgi:hypothetical protein
VVADERWARTYTLPPGFPDFAQTWYGDTVYPTGRGQERPLRGWVCSGCGHGFGPAVRECTHCPETPAFIGKTPAVPDDEDYER